MLPSETHSDYDTGLARPWKPEPCSSGVGPFFLFRQCTSLNVFFFCLETVSIVQRYLLEFCLKRQLLEEKEEHISSLQLELEEKYQEALAVEKNKWQKEQETDTERRIENEVKLAKARWDAEQKEVWVQFLSACCV